MKPVLCDKCKKNPATVHMQQFVLGQKAEYHLCQECTFKFDSPDIPIGMENVFKGFMEQMQSKLFAHNQQAISLAGAESCQNCGMTGDELKSGGKLGCRECYASFQKEACAILKNVQGSTRHTGKFPKRLGQEMMQLRHAGDLRAKLAEAVSQENFELAANLRDEIRALETS